MPLHPTVRNFPVKALLVNLNLAIDKAAKVSVLRPGRIYRFADTLTQPGGKGMNVARVLKELGCRPVIAGFVSGHNGRWIAERLSADKFPSLLVRHGAGESRICYSIADNRGVSMDFSEEGPAVPPSAQSLLLKKLAQAAGSFRVAAVCGRASMGIRKDFYTRLTHGFKKAGCFTAFDACGEPLMEGILAGADLVKINKSEFEEAFGVRLSRRGLRKVFDKYSPGGLKALIVTNGPGRTLAVARSGMWTVWSVPLRRVESPVGAGDSFMAGFIAGFMKGLPFEAGLRLATGCAASDCLTLSAGRISRGEAGLLAGSVEVRELQNRTALMIRRP
ncbi:MAG: PfkB family carbohydrate kinase [Elusimicrobiales bacterium]|jgi:1-phosphofructokinase family hexose kinase